MDTVIFYHITDEEDYNFSNRSNKYNKTTFVTKRMNSTIIYNSPDLGTNIWNQYRVLSNGDILDKQYNLTIKPFKGYKILLNSADKSDISSVVFYDNDTYFIYPQDLGSYSSATYNISPIINIDSWIIYYKTKDDNQFLATYCPINDIHHFSIIDSSNIISLESLALI